MADQREPSCRLIARLYNATHEIARLRNPPAALLAGQPPELVAERVRGLLRRARRAVAREAGLVVPTGFEPTRDGAEAALAAAAAALEEVARRYRARCD